MLEAQRLQGQWRTREISAEWRIVDGTGPNPTIEFEMEVQHLMKISVGQTGSTV